MMLINQTLRDRADQFAHKFHKETDEDGEAKTFMDELFRIFSLDRYELARFEQPIVRKSTQRKGRADLFWRGKLLIEAKSGHLDKDKDWENTLNQAIDYVQGLTYVQNRPEYVLLINFKRMKLYRMDDTPKETRYKPILICNIALLELAENLEHFAFFLTAKQDLEAQEVRVNQQAADLIATIHDSIELKKYSTHNTAILLSQILFCLFAEDTGIFPPLLFTEFVQQYQDNPQQLGAALLQLFEALNTPKNKRKNLGDDFANFPYVNGDLFQTTLSEPPPTPIGVFQSLHNACLYDWSAISPEIFGSLFQAVMNSAERRTLGAHYTSETNILRLLKPLFLNDLKAEFESIKTDKRKVERFRQKISKIRFLDPACGCGNFLVVTYREMRLLDMQVVAAIQHGQYVTDTTLLSNIPLSNFFGYEIDATSARIATIAMWLTEHQMNVKFLDSFGTAQPSIPLDNAAQIINDNALRIPWQKDIDFIIGNPPFVGKKEQTSEQKQDLLKIFNNLTGAGNLDYVTAWYVKAGLYLQEYPNTQIAFVSTNSISQGEQVGTLWRYLINSFDIKINFAHQTFKWMNEAKGIAAVHCVIIGFGKNDMPQKYLFEYPDIKSDPISRLVKNINPYLVEAKNIFIEMRNTPISTNVQMNYGSMPIDNGNLILSDEEKNIMLEKEPNAQKYIYQYTGGQEFINNQLRWCLWLKNIQPYELKALPEVYKRVKNNKEYRESSNRETTVKLAQTPHLFGEIRQPDTDYILVPKVSSENRKYIPIGFYPSSIIASGSCLIVPNSSLFHFGILTSIMHMTWMKYVCGRLESRFQYSASIVYNNYPFPKDVSDKKRSAVETAAQTVLDIRVIEQSKGNTLADLYDPNTMPFTLRKAHEVLDKAVDKCYRDAAFTSDAKRIEYLFELYENYTAGLFVVEKKKRTKK